MTHKAQPDTAELYRLRFRFTGPLTRIRDYNIDNICRFCYSGAVLASPVIVDNYREFKARLITYSGKEWLVRNDLRDQMVAAGLRGAMFRPVEIKRCAPDFEWHYFELTTDAILPPLDPSSHIDREEICSVCGRGGYFEMLPWTDEVLVYDRRELDQAVGTDFYRSYEYWGELFPPGKPGTGSLFPDQSFIVSVRTKTFFETAKIRGLIYQPVFIK